MKMEMEREDLLFILASLLFIQAFLFANIVPALIGAGIMLYVGILRLSFEPNVRGERTIGKDKITEDETLTSRLKLRNDSKIPLKIEIIEENPNFEAERLNLLLEPLEEKEVEYTLKPKKKGSFELEGPILRVRDLRGLYYEELRSEGKASVDVYPSVESIKEASKADKNVRFAEEALQRLHVGMDSLEIHGLREFQAGDDARHIDWKATARLGEIIVREFLREFKGEVYLLIDGSREIRREMKKSKVDYMSLLVSQLGYYLLSRTYPVGMIVFDDFKVLKVINARGVRGQLNVLLEGLKVSPSRGLSSLKVPKLSSRMNNDFLKRVMPFLKGRKGHSSGIMEASSRVPVGSFSIIVTDAALRPKELIAAVENLKKKKAYPLIIALNPILFMELKDLTKENLPSIYRNYIEREELVRKISLLAPIIEVGPKDLAKEVVEAMK